MGAQARPDYLYMAKRRAKFGIIIGHEVTPITDPGDYIVNTNVDLVLEAGEYIHIYPGTHFKAGSTAHLWINYDDCDGHKTALNDSDTPLQEELNEELVQRANQRNQTLIVYPNPSASQFTIAALDGKAIENFEIYDLSGTLVFQEQGIDKLKHTIDPPLMKGVYLFILRTDTDRIQTKIVKL